MSPRLLSSLVILSLAVVACGGRVDREEPASSDAKSKSSSKAPSASRRDKPAKSGSAAPSVSAASAGAAPTGISAAPSAPAAGAKEFTLKSHDRAVKVTFAPPAGWKKDPLGERADAVVFQGAWLAIFNVSLTCQGNCDKDQAILKKNIETQFQDDFDAATSKNVKPVLTGEWLMKPKEEPAGVVTASFLARDGDKVMAQHYIRSQLLADVPFFVECRVKLDEREPAGTFEKLQQACKDLRAELQPK